MKGGKLTDVYFTLVSDSERKYGKNTVVFMEKGHFMELYGLENSTETIGNITELCKFLGIECSFTNSKDLVNNPGNTRDNPLFGGIPTHAYPKYIRKLLDANYTIVEYTETENNPDNSKKREVTSIISKGCYLDEESTTSNIVCVYGEVTKHHRTQERILILGLCCIDITTGKSTVYETYDKPNDTNFAINEAYRFIQVSRPKQVLICDSFEGINTFVQQLDLQKTEYTIVPRNKHNEKLEYQKQFYQKIFPCNGNILEYLQLARYNFASTAYVYALYFIYERNKTFIENLKQPVYWNDASHMILHYNTIYQLDLYSKELNKPSLCNILNHCRTKGGRRMFEERLLNPLTNVSSIDKRYKAVAILLEYENKMPPFKVLLDGVYDLDRLFRRLTLEVIQPIGLHQIYTSIRNILAVITGLQDLKIKNFAFSGFHTVLQEFQAYLEKVFVLDGLKSYSNTNKDIDFSIFQKGTHQKIDDILENQECLRELDDYIEVMEQQHTKTKPNKNKRCFEKKKEKKTYVLGITKSRYQQYLATTTLTDPKYLTFTDTGKGLNCRLTNQYIEGLSQKIKLSTDSLNELTAEYFRLHLQRINQCYQSIYFSVAKFISHFDVTLNNAQLAQQYAYCKPVLDTECEDSYMEIQGLRHPIVERIRPQEKYIPNDVRIGKKEAGLILFGPNAGGKSTTLKALGIVAIMAQAGLFVPCKSFKYSLYHNISSRILGNDDLSKGHSSFEVEMLELNHILRRSDNHSLVLGDEICRGTTTIDALSLVASSVVELAKRKTNFMYTTHLHKLKDLECIKNLDNVGIYHIHVRIENGKVIYERTLKPGNGSTMYGIEIARAMQMDDAFIKNAYAVRDILLNQESFILSQKPSKYNSSIYMGNCEICQTVKGEDTHHIGFQCMANDQGLIEHYHKNIEHNLVTLCKKCHGLTHQYRYKIKGWNWTSRGKELDYSTLNEQESLVYKQEMTEKIQQASST